MTETLYIIITSDRPDQYLNVILHCLQYRSTTKIVFLQVEGRPDSDDDPNITARSVRESVEALLAALADQGNYKYLAKSDKYYGREVPLREKYALDRAASIKQQYHSLKTRNYSMAEEDIHYSQLKDRLINIHRHRKESEYIIDVSAARKPFLSDILAIAIVEKFDNVYTIDLKRGPNFDEPWKSLFHELEYKKRGGNGYSYVQLTTTPIFGDCRKSILILNPSLVLTLLAATAVLAGLIITSAFFGNSNWFILIIGFLAAIASLLSLVSTVPKFIRR
jgi:hypothetical protein